MVGLLAGTGVAAAAPAAVGAAAPAASGPVGGRGDGGAGQLQEKPGSPATPLEHATPLTAPEPKAAPPVPPGAAPGLAPTAYRHYYTYYGPTNVPSGAIWEAWVYCPSGMVATGGGEYNNNSGGVVLTASGPIDSGWRVEVWNRSSVASTFTVYAVCMTGITDYQVATGSPGTIPAGSASFVYAYCPGHQTFSGGFRADTATIEATDTAPLGGGGWSTYLRNRSSGPTTAVGQVVCGNGLSNFDTFVKSADVAIGPGGYASATVTCPNGTYAVGGGVAGQALSQPLTITDSYPISTFAWRVYARNDGAATTMWALAVCGS